MAEAIVVFNLGSTSLKFGAVCARLAALGVALDIAANASAGPCISTPESRGAVWVVSTNEDRMIADHARAPTRAARRAVDPEQRSTG